MLSNEISNQKGPSISDVLSHASFVRPTRFGSSNWQEHAPFVFWIVDAIQPRIVIELGARADIAYLTLCQAITNFAPNARFHGFDLTDDATPMPAADPAYAAISSFGRAEPGVAADSFRDGSIDLLHIHSRFDGPRAHDEIRQWLAKASSRCVVLIDGAGGESTSAIDTVRNELKVQYPSLTFEHANGLTVVGIGASLPDPVQKLFALDVGQQAFVRAAYARFGETIGLAAANDRQKQQVARQQVELADRAETHTLLEQDIKAHTSALRDMRVSLARSNGAMQNVLQSTSWRISAPVRLVGVGLRKFRVSPQQLRFFTRIVMQNIRTVGVAETARKIVRRLPSMGAFSRAHTVVERRIDPEKMPPPLRDAAQIMALRVVLIAETSLPQCLKYRVLQKQKMIESLGYDCTVIKWSDYQACLDALQTHAVAIFYRVPGFPTVLDLIETARTLRVKTYWEVDDLIFDIDKYRANTNLQHLTPELRNEVLSGVPLYLGALKACDAGIGSTAGIAKAMRDVGVEETHIIENGYDEETLSIAAQLTASASPRTPEDVADAPVRIVYGSGSKAHDADFLEAAAGIRKVLERYPRVELHIAGELNLPPTFEPLMTQVHRVSASDYPQYLKWLSGGDINIGPLEDTEFNDGKSNIKFLEAAAVMLPSVCSPRAAFVTAITDGVDGFLADNDDEWFVKLSRLVEDPALRRDVGVAARESALAHYRMQALMTSQVKPLLERFETPKPRLSILGVNIFYAPRSFGGATIVAEEIAKRLCRQDGIRYSMFTSAPVDVVPAYQTVRYESNGVHVYAMGLPPNLGHGTDFENYETHEPFRQALRAARPDIVHIHCVQGIGATLIDVCKEENVPVAVTLHDAWWICARQFMITGGNRYCNQVKIDLDVCARCLGGNPNNPYRQHRLASLLHSADMLLAPSAFFRDLYIANGFDTEKIFVDKNGVLGPRRPRPSRTSLPEGKLRFGFLGGVGPIKGYDLLKEVFTRMNRDDYELVLVDNALNLGLTTIQASKWNIKGTLTVIPAFTQDSIDDFYERIDVLLFPTQWKESFGLAVREALVRDVWVVATDGGGVVEDIAPGVNGNVIPLTDDGTELQKAIVDLLDTKDRFIQYRNPRAKEIKLFDSHSEHVLNLLEQEVERSVAARSRVRSDSAVSAA